MIFKQNKPIGTICFFNVTSVFCIYKLSYLALTLYPFFPFYCMPCLQYFDSTKGLNLVVIFRLIDTCLHMLGVFPIIKIFFYTKKIMNRRKIVCTERTLVVAFFVQTVNTPREKQFTFARALESN